MRHECMRARLSLWTSLSLSFYLLARHAMRLAEGRISFGNGVRLALSKCAVGGKRRQNKRKRMGERMGVD